MCEVNDWQINKLTHLPLIPDDYQEGSASAEAVKCDTDSAG